MLPESIQLTAVRHLPDHQAYSGIVYLPVTLMKTLFIELTKVTFITTEDGTESAGSSSLDTVDEELDHHLLTITNSDVAFLDDKPVRLAKEVL